MTALVQYWVYDRPGMSCVYPTPMEHGVAVFKAADVEALVKDVIPLCRVVKLLVDTGHKWDGYTLDYEKAQRLLATLEVKYD